MTTRIFLEIFAASGIALAGQQVALAEQQTVHVQRAAGTLSAQRAAQALSGRAAAYAERLQGVRYVYGGTGNGGFDCSGLTQYVYSRIGRPIARTAEDQFRQFRPVGRSRAWGGDLVFFHDSPDPSSRVYHVGVYEGGDEMVAASAGAGHVTWESFAWAGNTVTFGTLTH